MTAQTKIKRGTHKIEAKTIKHQSSSISSAQVKLFALLSILFNPIIPIHLSRKVWAFFNVVCAGIFVGHLILNLKKNT